jgi:hypothetical protein
MCFNSEISSCVAMSEAVSHVLFKISIFVPAFSFERVVTVYY